MGSLTSKQQDRKESLNSASRTHKEEGKTRKPFTAPETVTETQEILTSEVQAPVHEPSTHRNGNNDDPHEICSTAGLVRRRLKQISSSSSDDDGIIE